MRENENKRTVGTGYEKKAAQLLAGKGMRILATNFRGRTGEIDLVAQDGACLVFVEVKYRADEKMGDALEAVDPRKQRRIIRTAQYFLLRHGYPQDMPCRFDVVGITGARVTHVENAFWAT